MGRFSLTGVIVMVIVFLVLAGFVASKLNVAGTHQELPGITENVTAGNLFSQGAEDFAAWFRDSFWPWSP